MRMATTVTMAFAIWAAGCERSPKGSEYMPCEVGMRWLYECTFAPSAEPDQPPLTMLREDRVVGQTEIGGATYYEVALCRRYPDGVPRVFTIYVRTSSDGRYIRTSDDPDPAETRDVPFPIKLGMTWTVIRPNGIRSHCRVEGIETLTTNDCTYERCLKETSRRRSEGGFTQAATLWFARGIGFVKSIGESAEGSEEVNLFPSHTDGRDSSPPEEAAKTFLKLANEREYNRALVLHTVDGRREFSQNASRVVDLLDGLTEKGTIDEILRVRSRIDGDGGEITFAFIFSDGHYSMRTVRVIEIDDRWLVTGVVDRVE